MGGVTMRLKAAASSGRAKEALRNIAVTSLRSKGYPGSFHVLVFPEGTAIPAELRSIAIAQAIYNPTVSAKDGTLLFAGDGKKITVVNTQGESFPIRLGLMYSGAQLDATDHTEVPALLVRARQEAAEAAAKRVKGTVQTTPAEDDAAMDAGESTE